MDISRAGAARAAAAATGQRLGAVDRGAASLLRTGLFTRATKTDDGKLKSDDDPDATGQGEDASSADKSSDDTKVDAKSDDDAKEEAADEREDDSEQKASDKKKLPNAVDREGDVPSLKDKESLSNADLTETPWDDTDGKEKREISPPIDHEEDDTPVKHAKTGPAAEDTIDDMMSRDFSYGYTTDSDEKIPVPPTQKSADDHNYLNTVSNVSFTPDTDDDEQRGKFDGSENDPGPLPSGDATPIEDLEKNRSLDDTDDETPSTPTGAMAGVPAS